MHIRTLRTLALSAVAALGMLAVPNVASAAFWGRTVGYLNLRSCPSVNCGKITTMPPGAAVRINGSSGGWYHLNFRGIAGYASARYITTAAAPPVMQRPPPPAFGYCRRPWWDSRYGAWYDGCRWYYRNRWYNRPSFFFGFRFGG